MLSVDGIEVVIALVGVIILLIVLLCIQRRMMLKVIEENKFLITSLLNQGHRLRFDEKCLYNVVSKVEKIEHTLRKEERNESK